MYEIGTKQVAITGNTLTVAQRVPTYPVSAAGFEPSVVTMGVDGLNPGSRNAWAVQAVPMGYNGATADMWRSNTEGTMLTSLGRTATVFGADIICHNANAVTLILDITVASGTGGLQINLQIKDPASGKYVYLAANPAAILVTGTYGFVFGTGASSAASAGSAGIVQNRIATSLGRTLRPVVVHGDVTSYTYSLGYSFNV